VAVVFHEFGHLLLNHKAPVRKVGEHAADSIAVQFTRESASIRNVVETANNMFVQEKSMLEGGGVMGKWAASLMGRRNRNMYGSFAERVANIEATPIVPTKDFKQLIANRNQREIQR
jgi:hypothetical protein